MASPTFAKLFLFQQSVDHVGDGMIRISGRDYNGTRESPCFVDDGFEAGNTDAWSVTNP